MASQLVRTLPSKQLLLPKYIHDLEFFAFTYTTGKNFLLTAHNTVKGERVRFTERTQPAGTFKAHFFQDLFQSPSMPGFLMAMRVFYDSDTYVSLPGGFKTLDYLVRNLKLWF